MSDNTEVKVSVIIPVYNAEKYIQQCLDSIINQTLKEIEIICVDDGSTDESVKIIKSYEKIDSRVHIYTQDNQFAGVARNNGMQHATGKYLVFWDCDDYFEINALEELYNQIEEDSAQICVCGARRYDEELGKSIPCPGYLKEKMLPEQIPFNIDSNNDYILNFTCEAPWNKIYLKSFIDRIGIKFQNTRNGNDLYFVNVAFCMAERITVTDQVLINYRRNRENSLINTVDEDPFAIFRNEYNVKVKLDEHNILPRRSFDNRILSVIIYQLNLSKSLDAFLAKVEWLKKEGIALYDLKMQDEGYYYVEWHREFLGVLLKEEPYNVLFWLQNHNYHNATQMSDKRKSVVERLRNSQTKLNDIRKKNQELKQKIDTKNNRIEKQRECIDKQKNRLQKQKETIQSQKELIQKQKTILNMPLVRIALKIYKLFKKI